MRRRIFSGVIMSERGEKAEKLFREGYNCSQAVFCAFRDVTGLELDEAAKLASPFGGGMGRLREVCGAVSGALLVLGVVEGYSTPGDPEAKKKHYERVREFARRFTEKNGSIVCRELLSGVGATVGGDPDPRTDEFYKKRPCPNLIRDAADIVGEMLNLS